MAVSGALFDAAHQFGCAGDGAMVVASDAVWAIVSWGNCLGFNTFKTKYWIGPYCLFAISGQTMALSQMPVLE